MPKHRLQRIAPLTRLPRLVKAPGSKAETYRITSVNPETGKATLVRRRARRAQGQAVNPTLDLPWSAYPYIEDNEDGYGPQCAICGGLMREERLGVSWADGEAKVREAAGVEKGGGYRSRGPVLWAMRVVKFERFGEEHWRCFSFFPVEADRPPPDIAWLCIWASSCELSEAIAERPELLKSAWIEWAMRERNWAPAVRRKLRRTYDRQGAEGVQELIWSGVAYTTRDDKDQKVKRTWDAAPF